MRAPNYKIAPFEFSLGLGVRYWAMQIPTGTTDYFSTNVFYNERFSTEQTAVFAQGSYKFAGAE